MESWRAHSFGPASELPYRRRTSDWIRLVIGASVFAFTIWHQDDPTQFERNLFTFVNGLPDQLDSFFRLLYAVGALWAVGLVVVAALVARRWRLARDLAIGGFVTWVLARFVGTLVVENASSAAQPRRRHPDRRRHHELPRGTGRDHRRGHLGRVAVPHPPGATPRAVPRAAHRPRVALPRARRSPTVRSRPWRSAGRSRASCTSRSARPADGPPPRRSKRRSASSGSQPTTSGLLPEQPRTGTVMSARDADGALAVRVLGRDEADAQLLSKSWRFLAYKDGGPTLHTTRLEDVEAQAYALLLAERAGVRVPPVVVAGTAGPGAALIAIATARRHPPGRRRSRVGHRRAARRPLAAGGGAARRPRRPRSPQREPRRARRRRRSASPASRRPRVRPPRADAPPTSPSSW